MKAVSTVNVDQELLRVSTVKCIYCRLRLIIVTPRDTHTIDLVNRCGKLRIIDVYNFINEIIIQHVHSLDVSIDVNRLKISSHQQQMVNIENCVSMLWNKLHDAVVRIRKLLGSFQEI